MRRDKAHTPLNFLLFHGLRMYLYVLNTFKMYEDEHLKEYTKGSDEFYYHEINYYDTYEPVCPSIKDYIYEKPKDFSICTLGQMHSSYGKRLVRLVVRLLS